MLYAQKHKHASGDVFVVLNEGFVHEDEKRASGLYGALDVLSQGKFGATPLWEAVRIDTRLPHVPANLGPFSVGIISGPTFDEAEKQP